MEFVTLLRETPNGLTDVSPEELQTMLGEYMEWTSKLRGQSRIVAEKSLDNTTGSVIKGYGEEAIVSDGPFVEAKEIIGGLHIIEAETIDEAIAWARTCPALKYGGRIEVRAIESWSGEEK
jgi:hypothetical protein